jgi:hypothetical protein
MRVGGALLSSDGENGIVSMETMCGGRSVSNKTEKKKIHTKRRRYLLCFCCCFLSDIAIVMRWWRCGSWVSLRREREPELAFASKSVSAMHYVASEFQTPKVCRSDVPPSGFLDMFYVR